MTARCCRPRPDMTCPGYGTTPDESGLTIGRNVPSRVHPAAAHVARTRHVRAEPATPRCQREADADLWCRCCHPPRCLLLSASAPRRPGVGADECDDSLLEAPHDY